MLLGYTVSPGIRIISELKLRKFKSTRLSIHVNDDPDENILIRLPEACQFIESALDSGGRIYVHCMMGISRSVTVVCAYCE